MGKIFVLSVTDHEEYILSRIMEIIAAEPEFDHIVSSHPRNILVFPGLELRLKERTVHRNVDFYDPSGICNIGIFGKPPILGIFCQPDL